MVVGGGGGGGERTFYSPQIESDGLCVTIYHKIFWKLFTFERASHTVVSSAVR